MRYLPSSPAELTCYLGNLLGPSTLLGHYIIWSNDEYKYSTSLRVIGSNAGAALLVTFNPNCKAVHATSLTTRSHQQVSVFWIMFIVSFNSVC